MRGKSWSTARVLVVLSLLSALVLVSAECPNGCSGNGDCMSKDMCQCYKNYQGNDCADRICAFGRAHVDTPKGDINMDKDRLTPGWLLNSSQAHPWGTYEHFSPDAAADEAHFYMECSNKGICDRSTGLCQCFDGYEGNGCRRTTCPSRCSGHGTCESIRELGLKAAGTLFGKRGPAGVVTYDLWDSNSTHGCRCDPWFHGPDCSKRSCKVGVDPLFLGEGTPTYETFIVHAVATTLDAAAWIRLRMFDYHGESYTTQKIKVTGTAATDEAAVATAIKAIPNLTFQKVACATQGTGTLAGFLSTPPVATGLSVACTLMDNPGKMRVPEIAASSGFSGAVVLTKVTTTTQQGFDDEWFTVKSADVASSVDAGFLAITTSVAPPLLANAYQLVKIDDNIMLVKGTSATQLLLEFGMKHSIGGSPPVFTAPTGLLTITPGLDIFAAAAVGDDSFTFDGTIVSAPYTAGDLLFFQNQFFYVQSVAKVTNWIVKLDKPFGGSSLTGGPVAVAAGVKVYKIGVSADKTLVYKYISECSGRGMCGYDTGICTCFKGYTDDNCDTQNIIAV